jgi:hypothetical protein
MIQCIHLQMPRNEKAAVNQSINESINQSKQKQKQNKRSNVAPSQNILQHSRRPFPTSQCNCGLRLQKPEQMLCEAPLQRDALEHLADGADALRGAARARHLVPVTQGLHEVVVSVRQLS